jgi:hypothetical protein
VSNMDLFAIVIQTKQQPHNQRDQFQPIPHMDQDVPKLLLKHSMVKKLETTCNSMLEPP